MKILYLHGFRSSPQSHKSRLMAQRMEALGRGADFICPHLPASPKLAVELALGLAAQAMEGGDEGGGVGGGGAQGLALVGSSLGGYYATYLAERLGCRAVLLNPAVKPPRDLESYVGVSTEYHSGLPFEFKHEYIAELRALEVAQVSRPQRYFLIAATGDEVLDWRDMVAHYPGAQQRVIEGSDHGIAEFADYLDPVLAFCGIPQPGLGPK